MTDTELLHHFVETADEKAFTSLVERHFNLVYNVARRRVEDHHVAEEVCQEVFTALAKKARRLAKHEALHAWLFRAAIYQCARHHRSRSRRQRCQEDLDTHLALMNELETAASGELSEEALKVLDDCVDSLKAKDREIILQRYYRGHSLKEIGDHLGITENASQKRLARVLRKLERLMIGRGAAISSTVLAGILTSSATKGAPSGMATAVAERVLANSTGVASASGAGVGFWLTSHFKAALLCGVAGFCIPLGADWLGERGVEAAAPTVVSAEELTEPIDPLVKDPLFAGILDPAERMRLILDLEDENQRLVEIRFLVRQLSESEIPIALEVLANKDPEESRHLAAFIDSWARVDSEAAFAFIESRDSQYQKDYVKSFINGWVDVSPSASWKFVSSFDHNERGTELLEAWLHEMSHRDPLKALAMLETKPEKTRSYHFEQLFINWPDNDASKALAAIARIDGRQDAEKALSGLIQSSNIVVSSALLEEVRRAVPKAFFQEVEAMMVAKWLEKEPADALTHIGAISESKEQTRVLIESLEKCSMRSHHQEALNLLVKSAPEQVSEHLYKLVQGWFIYDEKTTFQGIQNMEPEHQRVVGEMLGEWMAQRSRSQIREQTEEIADEETRHLVLKGAIEKLTEVDFAHAVALMEQVDDVSLLDATFTTFAKAYAENDPQEALEWARQNAPEEKRAEAVREAVTVWAKRDQLGAVAWREALSDPELRDSSAAAISKASLDQPETAVAWALEIEDPSIRLTSLAEATEQWARVDASGLSVWLENQPKPTRQSLLKDDPWWLYLTKN